jgi:magnesium chelatase subunit I
MFPFTAIVGQDLMKLALILNAINPRIGGVLIRGEKGTAKSTAVRALAALLPEIVTVAGCPFSCPPDNVAGLCATCAARASPDSALPVLRRRTRVVELPVSASEDRVVGSLDLEHALLEGRRRFAPGLLADANRGILYVDEVNLLDDHVVDVLLDAAAMGTNFVEREGISFTHPARFMLVGTMNPEEGELRPQLLDRFGLCVDVRAIRDIGQRVAIIERREAFERDPDAFIRSFAAEEAQLAQRMSAASQALPDVRIPRAAAELIAMLNIELDVDGHRGDIVLRRAAQTLAAFHTANEVTTDHIFTVAPLALTHRLNCLPGERAPRSVSEALAAIRQRLGV